MSFAELQLMHDNFSAHGDKSATWAQNRDKIAQINTINKRGINNAINHILDPENSNLYGMDFASLKQYNFVSVEIIDSILLAFLN